MYLLVATIQVEPRQVLSEAKVAISLFYGTAKAQYASVVRLSLDKYTLIITEKPDGANRIASALDAAGNAKKMADNGVPYYLAKRSENIVVVPALGHLYTVTSGKKGRYDYPVFDFQWVPRYMAERGAARIRSWLNVISKLAENADKFIDACDYDVEGSI